MQQNGFQEIAHIKPNTSKLSSTFLLTVHTISAFIFAFVVTWSCTTFSVLLEDLGNIVESLWEVFCWDFPVHEVEMTNSCINEYRRITVMFNFGYILPGLPCWGCLVTVSPFGFCFMTVWGLTQSRWGFVLRSHL